ncbi:hypothetical protein C7N43_30740 [Sphingobacteriales bacterium UPWRP_1]|nr:hypothetical protein B6N25_09785 [Sphingobacteriales bacterium TSM_CSS]PSJ73104.1 hypothetical protein C7N43_30740 [Sphingobacteriales bacterium UPWRP_1]
MGTIYLSTVANQHNKHFSMHWFTLLVSSIWIIIELFGFCYRHKTQPPCCMGNRAAQFLFFSENVNLHQA